MPRGAPLFSGGAGRERVPRGAGVRRLIPNKRVVDVSALAAATDAGLIELTFAGTLLSESREAGVGDRGANYSDPLGDVLVYGRVHARESGVDDECPAKGAA